MTPEWQTKYLLLEEDDKKAADEIITTVMDAIYKHDMVEAA